MNLILKLIINCAQSKATLLRKKPPNLMTSLRRSFISETEEIILLLHGLQASSQPFPEGNADQVERVQRRATNRSEV